MRTLLIDNHDSFTYNLYQYLAACNDEPPLVIRNDERPWAEVEHLDFECIVISPGPGRPQRPADLGLSADALRHARVPVLGVCLGHQAIGHHCGATVDLAVRPMHGRIDRIRHCAADLFRGIPNDFEAVRYHSLAVTRLPSELEPLAWTSDGTLMAMRHSSRPWWGVQFHPESICTEFGARLLRNFRDLAQAWRDGARRVNTMGSFLPEFRLGNAHALEVHARCLDLSPDPDQVFAALFSHSPCSFWLDTSLVTDGGSRFSFMGDGSGPRSKRVTYRTKTSELQIHAQGVVETRTQSIFDYLREHVPPPQAGPAQLPFDFVGGFVGYFGYELNHELGDSPAHGANMPDSAWLLVDRFIAFDHAQQQTWLVCLDDTSLSTLNLHWCDAIEHRLRNELPLPATDLTRAAKAVGPMHWQIDLPEYRQRIVRAQHEILQGETYEVCLTNQLIGQGAFDAPTVYRSLRSRNPAPYAAFLSMPDMVVLCASPELFLRLEADASVMTRPIKGTARRGASASDDMHIKEALAADEKTRSENLMIVDLLRNDLNRVCELGSVHVPGMFEIETFATVHQMVSTVRGKLRAGLNVLDCVQATFPGGSMTGAPKERTMRIIDGFEETGRGVYAGSIGYLSFSGTAQLNIVIRTIVSAGGQVSIGSGGAIIALSDPDDEVAEILLKARAAWEVLQQCGAAAGTMPGSTQSSELVSDGSPAPPPSHGCDG